MKKDLENMILATVNAPYGCGLDAARLAALLIDSEGAKRNPAPVFAFLSDVSPALQRAFITEAGLSEEAVAKVARLFSAMAGYKLALAC